MISVVIPLRNEEQNIPLLAQKLTSALGTLAREYEVIFINDGSTDATSARLREICAADTRLKAIHFRRNCGQTAAMQAGFIHARGEIIVAMDGDLQNDPADIGRLLAKLDEGYDLVSGWRKDRQDHPIKRNFLSRVANGLISRTTGVHLHDYGCSLKAYRREILEGIALYGEMHRFIPVYAYWNGARIAEVPVTHHPRVHGASNYGLERVVKVVLDLGVVLFLHRYAQKPIYVFGLCGLFSWAIGGLAGLAALLYKLFGEKSFIQTPLPLIAITMFFTGAICFLLGLLAELSIRIYHESQGKPTYVVASRDNLEGPARRAGDRLEASRPPFGK
ncbi:MAG TPA: glycosyltransferase family 2 protein [Opitutaceae bacterium]|nr:glycosyltransferase family 2 protein [Opitutaceae bacterium]